MMKNCVVVVLITVMVVLSACGDTVQDTELQTETETTAIEEAPADETGSPEPTIDDGQPEDTTVKSDDPYKTDDKYLYDPPDKKDKVFIPKDDIIHDPILPNDGDNEPEEAVIDPEELLPLFTASPLAIEDIEAIVVLGNLNPSGHTFPTDHIYFYIVRENDDRPLEVDLFAPGDLTVTRMSAIEHVDAGITDYDIEMQKSANFIIRLGHVTSLSEDCFGDTASFETWELNTEYSTGGETYRRWGKDCNIPIEAGQLIGTTGGHANQWALDLTLYDMQVTQQDVANISRWRENRYLQAVDPLAYYEQNEIFDLMLVCIDRDMAEGEMPPYGSVLQDIPGTAQGCWFLKGVMDTYPEDPHMALVYDNIYPDDAVLSCGTSVEHLQSCACHFIPEESGLLNRDFGDITPDGNIYGFRVEEFNGIVIVQMPDTDTLWVEALPGAGTDPSSWQFTDAKTVFVR